jgi:hypothetical protein
LRSTITNTEQKKISYALYTGFWGKENIQCEAVENDTISIVENTGRYAFHLYIIGLHGAVVAFLAALSP